jgi:NodT family efflux transporter outer membrane factor (OMF) lipoprotein
MNRSLHLRCLPGLLVATVCALGGCGSLTRTEYQRPALDIPEQWESARLPSSGAAIADNETWWHRFGDPQLDTLIDRALRTNNDLAAAAMRLYIARLQADLAATNLTPDIAVNARDSVARNLAHGGPSARAASASLSINYEVDLWGRLSRQRDAARFEAVATDYDRRAAALTIIGQTATAYWQIAALKRQAATTDENIETTRRILELVRTQHEAGAVSEFETAQAASAVAALEAQRAQIQAQLEQQRNALAIIFDQSPNHREPELATLPVREMPPLPAVLPADVLARRPDLQAAKMRLRETLAAADTQRLAFYPTFSLFGSVESGGSSVGQLLRDPIGTLGGALALPFLQWNTADLTIRSTRAQFDAAVIDFRSTFYKALADTRSAWSACVQSDQEVSALSRSVGSAKRAEALAEIRYRAGETTLTDWLSLQQTRQQEEMRLTDAALRQYLNTLTLYLALGGDAAAQRTPAPG